MPPKAAENIYIIPVFDGPKWNPTLFFSQFRQIFFLVQLLSNRPLGLGFSLLAVTALYTVKGLYTGKISFLFYGTHRYFPRKLQCHSTITSVIVLEKTMPSHGTIILVIIPWLDIKSSQGHVTTHGDLETHHTHTHTLSVFLHCWFKCADLL